MARNLFSSTGARESIGRASGARLRASGPGRQPSGDRLRGLGVRELQAGARQAGSSDGSRHKLNHAIVLCLLLASPRVVAHAAEVQLQVQAPVAPDLAAARPEGVWLPSQRDMIRGVAKARESISEGNYTQPLRFLDDILAKKEDSWIPATEGDAIAGLKDTVREVLGNLPADGKAAYEEMFGPDARRLVDEAIATGDGARLLEAVERYFYTPAGMEAAMLLARQEADAGRFFAAALYYRQLLKTPEAILRFDPELSLRAAAAWRGAGNLSAAEDVLQAAVERAGRGQVTLGGKRRRLPTGEAAAEWLEQHFSIQSRGRTTTELQWTMFRGNASRNAETQGGLPHMRIRWDQQLLDYGRLEQLFEDFRAEYLQAGKLTPVASTPLAVGDVVLVRTPHNLLAVDFETGKRIWETERRRVDELEHLIRRPSVTSDEESDPAPARAFARRLWEDYLYGVVSSDGQRVFLVRDLPMPDAQDVDEWTMLRSRGIDGGAMVNRLCAYDLATEGKLAWQLDGAQNAELRGAFFLGAPMALGDELYCLAEIRGSAIELIALDAATGAVAWRQQLVHLERGVAVDRHRRLQASMPSYDAGILVCPTGAGVVIGLELGKRSLSWAYRYAPKATPDNRRRRTSRNGYQQHLEGGWTDAAVVLSGGRVLLTPPESDHLHCLDLQTGELLWKTPRKAMNRLACVDQERLLLIGPEGAEARSLADGQLAWDEPLKFDDDHAPTGAGFLAEGKYYLPLSSAEVVAIDMASGAIAGRTTAREGQVLGNLICHRGSVLSLNGRRLECFDQIDVLRQQAAVNLEKDPEDVGALRTLGEIAFNAGRLSEAIDRLTRAYGNAPDDYRTRDVLAECLITALDQDFVAYRDKLPLLQQLEDAAPKRQITLRRIEAEGYADAGQVEEAVAACLEIYRLAGDASAMIEIGNRRQVAAPRWVEAQLTAILEHVGPSVRAKVIEQVNALAPAADAAADPAGWDAYLAYFGQLTSIEDARVLQARRLSASGQTLSAQQAWLALADSATPAVRAEALAQISQGLHQKGQHRAAVAYDRQLATALADVPALAGQTGAEYVAALGQPAPTETDWPTGKVESPSVTNAAAATTRAARFPMWEIRLEQTDPVLGSGAVMISPRHRRLLARDSYGEKFFEAGLDHDQLGYVHAAEASSLYGASQGSLLIVSTGRQLAAYNTLATPGGEPEVLWRANLASGLAEGDRRRSTASGRDQRPGTMRPPRLSLDEQWLGVIGPLTPRSCVFQDQRRLHAVDPLTGVPHWSRSDVPAGCDLFGDDQLTFAVPKGSNRALVYSTVDGRRLGEVEVPPWQQRLATRGRHIISWSPRRSLHGGHSLVCLDAHAGEVLWSRDYVQDARVDIAQNRYVAVMTPGGKLEIMDVELGEAVVDDQLREATNLRELHLAVSSDSFSITTNQSESIDRPATPINPLDYQVINGQAMVYDRQSGQPRWATPAELRQQGLMLSQPADLPVLVFASVVPRRNASGRRDNIRLLVLDKASGRTLYRSESLPPSGGSHCVVRVVDQERRLLAVEMASRQVHLQFSDSPRPPAPPALAEVEGEQQAASGGLGRILGKFRALE